MDFSNQQIDWQHLPRHEEAQLHPVQPVFIKVLYLQNVAEFVVLSAACIAACYYIPALRQISYFILVPVLLMLYLVTGVILSRKRFYNMGFALRRHDLIYRSGWLFEKLHIVPLVKVQHCQIKKGPLERMYGLSSLRIYTAGVSGADVVIEGISDEQAQRLKDRVLQNQTSATESEEAYAGA